MGCGTDGGCDVIQDGGHLGRHLGFQSKRWKFDAKHVE